MRRQCEILAVNRSSLYYEGVGADPEELALMRRIDELHLEFPFFGSRRIGQELRDRAEAKHEPAVNPSIRSIRICCETCRFVG